MKYVIKVEGFKLYNHVEDQKIHTKSDDAFSAGLVFRTLVRHGGYYKILLYKNGELIKSHIAERIA